MMNRYFTECRTAEDLKETYRKMTKQLHPDCNPGRDTTADFQRMQEEYQWTWNRLKDVHRTAEGKTYTSRTETEEKAADYMEIINELVKLHGIEIELCGSWVWVTGNTREVKEELKQIGLRWSRNKAAWYWHSGEYRKKSGRHVSLEGIRAKYGSERFDLDPDPQPSLC